MSFDRFDTTSTQEQYRAPTFLSRPETIDAIQKRKWCDILVVGGGIHGACVARLAALNGLKTVLLEKNDYAFATSSRTSKMAHGGLRYLGMFDFRQVYEGIKAREDLLRVAEHLVKPQEFLIPVRKSENLFGLKLRLGLMLYDMFHRKKERRHRWSKGVELLKDVFGSSADQYSAASIHIDGLMNDTRLVLEHVIAARQEGGLCLNYAAVISLHSREDGQMVVGWSDVLSGAKYELRAGIVINCAGPWVPFVGRIKPLDPERVRYSQGVHLLFNKPWKGPALFLPYGGKGTYYFILPHFGGTLVGTTERDVDVLEEDARPIETEVEEILARLSKDVPRLGLDRTALYYCFAGVRTIALRKSVGPSAKLSRRHIWNYSQGVLNLIGGKYTTATWTAFEGLRMALKLSNSKLRPSSLSGRKLPGAAMYVTAVSEFRALAEKMSIPSKVYNRAIDRLGSRVRLFSEKEGHMEVLAGRMLRGEVEIALDMEQAETLEDLMRRRLELECTPGYGFEVLPEILSLLEKKRPHLNLGEEEARYRKRIDQLRKIMGI